MNQDILTPETLGLLGLSLVAGLMILNLLTFSAFAVDRHRAVNGDLPLPEVLLLSLAALGGWPAAKFAQLVLRHPRQTSQFRSLLNLVGLPVIAVAALVIYEEVDLWAVESSVMSFIGEATGAGPDAAKTVNIAPTDKATTAIASADSGGIDAGAVVGSVAGAATKALVMPTRFGPGSGKKAPAVGKTISAKATN